MTNSNTDSTDEKPPLPRNRGGRPRGSRNKPKDSLLTADVLKRLYERVEGMLDDTHKKYIRETIQGKRDVDAVLQAKLMIRYMELLFIEGAEWQLQAGKITQDFAKFAGEYRMSLKDLEDMTRKRREEAAKFNNDEQLVDITRESAFSRFESLHREPTEGDAG